MTTIGPPHLAAQRGIEIGTMLCRLRAWSGLGVALLNLDYGLVRSAAFRALLVFASDPGKLLEAAGII